MEQYATTEGNDLIDELIKACMPEFDEPPDFHGIDYDFI